MRVLHINCNYIGTTLHQLMIEHLDSFGVESEVFVPTYDKNIAVIKPNGNVYVSECFNKWDRLIFDYKQHKIIKAIEQHYDVASFDLIHAYTLFTDGNVARVLSEKYGVPYVVAVRNTDVNNFLKKMVHLRKRGLKTLLAAKRVFFLSNAYCETVFKRYVPTKYLEVISDKSEILPNGIDDFWHNNQFSNRDIDAIEQRIKEKQLIIIYVGGIDNNKNLVETCEAVNLLKESGWKIDYYVVGKIKDQHVYDDIMDKIIYHEPLPKEKLIVLYRNADIFVMPSRTESFGLVYAEAMSQGLPVIYTRGQGFDGQFPEGIIGYHVLPNQPESLAEYILLITENYRSLSNNCIMSVEKFQWVNICGRYAEIYQSCIRGQNVL